MSESSASPIIRLNLSSNSADVNARIARIISNPIASESALNEIRNLIFHIPIAEIENVTQVIAEKILNTAMQINSVQPSKEIDNFRHELLSILNTLNFRFSSSIPIEKLKTFFNYISDGSITDLTDALPIIRQTFEAAEGLSPQFLQEITELTISSCSKRIQWLLQNFDLIDSTYFNPFLTLLTVISFCARTFSHLKDQFISIFTLIEEIIKRDFQDDLINYSTLPLLALKARMIHCYSLSADTLFKNKPLSFLVESYLTILQKCPSSFHLLYEEIALSFLCLISSKRDPPIIQEYIRIFDILTDFTVCDIAFYISRQTIVIKLFDSILVSSKCNFHIIELMIKFSINSLFVSSMQYIQRCSRFQKTITYIFNKFKEMPPPHYRYHFSILFALHQLVKSMDETARHTIETSNEKSFDFNDIQQIISIVSNLFESISKILDCLMAVFESLAECRIRNDKLSQINLPSLPFSQIEIQYVHQVFTNLLFLLVNVRFLSTKCNFRYALQCINSDPSNNSKMCVTHLKLLKCYERVRKFISYIFQNFPKILKKFFHPLFMLNLWNGFFTEFFKRNDHVLTNSSFVHSFYSDIVTFSYIIVSLLQKCIDEMNNPRKGSVVIQTVHQVLNKINSQPEPRYDIKEKYVNSALIMIQKKVLNMIYLFSRRIEALTNIDDSIILMIEVFSLFSTFFRQQQKIAEFLNQRFIENMIIASNQREIGSSIILFFQYANKNAPRSLEIPQVIDFLIKPKYQGIRSLLIIYSIGKNKKELVYGDKERMKRILNVILNFLPSATPEERDILLKMMKKMPTSRTINIDESGMNPTFIINKFTIPAIDLIEANIKSIINSPKDENLWNQIFTYLQPIFDIENDLEFMKGFQNEEYNHKITNLLKVLIQIDHEKSFQLFYDISKENLTFFAHIIVNITKSSYSLTDSELFKLFTIIETKEIFNEFIQKVIYISDTFYHNLYFIQIDIANIIIKNIDANKIDPVSFALFVAHISMNKYLIRKQPPFPGNRFLFSELEILPQEIQELIEKNKEYLSRLYLTTKESKTIFFDYISDSQTKFNRYLYAEYSSVCTNESNADEFLNKLFDKLYNKNIIQLIGISSTLIRVYPSLIDKHLDQFDYFLKCQISNLSFYNNKDKLEIIREFLCALIRNCPDFLCKYENCFFEIMSGKKEFLSTYVPLLKAIKDSIPDSLFKKLKDLFIQRLREDGIDNLMSWDNFNTSKISCIGKWDSIKHYWPIAFVLFPAEITPTTIRQLAEVIKNCADQGFDIFHEIIQLLVNEDVICYLVSENKYEVLMNVIAQALWNYNLAVDNRDLRFLIDAIAFANDAGIRYLRTAIRNEKKFAFIQIAFEEEEHSRNLKEVILSDKDFVQSILKDEPNTLDSIPQLSFGIAALSDENLFRNPEIYEIVFKFFIKNLRCNENGLVYIEHFIQFISKNIDKLTRNDVLITLNEFFNTNSQIVLAMITQLLNEITKKNSSFKIEELVSLKFISNDIAYVFIKTVILPFIKNDNCQPEDFLNLIDPFTSANQEVENKISFPFILYLQTLLLLIDEIPSFTVTTDRAYELFCQCKKADEKHIIYEIWSKSKGETHFDTFFNSFLNSIFVYISSYQKNACENIKLPKNCPISLLNPLLKAIINFQKSPSIVVSLWTIISNNLDLFQNPLTTFWPLLIHQTLNLKHFAKKRQINFLTPLITMLTKLICSSPPPENKDHHVILFFANFVMFSLRIVIEQNQLTLKCITPIIKSSKKLVKKFGPQVNIVNTFFKIVLDFYQKSLKQTVEVFAMLMHFVSKMIKCAVLYDPTVDLDPICEMVFQVACKLDSPSWPSAYDALNTLLNYRKCVQKILSSISTIPNEEISIRLSSILWKPEFLEEIVSTKIIPFARKVFVSENSDQTTAKFMLTCLLVTIVNKPHGPAIDYLRQDFINSKVFRLFFLKYFVILKDMRPCVIKSVGHFLKERGYNLDSNDAANSELKAYLAPKKKRLNHHFVELEGTLNESAYKKLSEWNTAFNLPEFIRSDYMDSFEPFSSFKTDMRHNLQYSILNDMQGQKEIQKVSPFYIDTLKDSFIDVKTTKDELKKSIQNLSLHPLIVYNIEFARFLMLSSALKKKKPFARTLSPVFSPMIHQSLSNFMKRVGIRDKEVAMKHSLKFRKSLQTSFCQQKPPKPPIELFDANDKRSLESLVICLSPKIGEEEWNEIIFSAVKKGLKMKARNPIFMVSLLRLLPHLYEQKKGEEINYSDLPLIDPFWSAFIIDFVRKSGINDSNLVSRLSSSVLFSISNDDDITFLALKNVILKRQAINPIDFSFDIPLIMNDKALSLFYDTENDVFLIRGKSGITYRYLVNDRRLMNIKFSLLNYSLNFILKKFGDTRERGILLPAIQSICLPDSKSDIFLSETSCIPFSKIKREKMVFKTKKENILWKSLLAERLGALSAIQILFYGDFDINTALVSEKSVFFAYENIIQNFDSPDDKNIRLPLFIDRSFINGPFKNGIFASFLCFSYYKEEFIHFLGSQIDPDIIDNRLKKYSIPDSSADQVNTNIDKLIEFSLEDDIFNSVPWF